MRILRPAILPDNKDLVVFPLLVGLGVAGTGVLLGNPVVIALPLPNIERKDIGKEKGGQGASLATVVEKVLKEINRSARKAMAKVDLKGLAEKAPKETEKVRAEAEKVRKEAEGAVGGIGKKLKGLFGK